MGRGGCGGFNISGERLIREYTFKHIWDFDKVKTPEGSAREGPTCGHTFLAPRAVAEVQRPPAQFGFWGTPSPLVQKSALHDLCPPQPRFPRNP